jgi:hypothetical protein
MLLSQERLPGLSFDEAPDALAEPHTKLVMTPS